AGRTGQEVAVGARPRLGPEGEARQVVADARDRLVLVDDGRTQADAQVPEVESGEQDGPLVAGQPFLPVGTAQALSREPHVLLPTGRRIVLRRCCALPRRAGAASATGPGGSRG